MGGLLWLVGSREPPGFAQSINMVELKSHAMSKGFCAGTYMTCKTLWACRFMAEDVLSRLVVGPSLCQRQCLGRQP